MYKMCTIFVNEYKLNDKSQLNIMTKLEIQKTDDCTNELTDYFHAKSY